MTTKVLDTVSPPAPVVPHRPSIEVWKQLYTCIDTAPQRYPVETWSVDTLANTDLFNGMDIWPIIKSCLLLRAANYFHTETGRRVLIDPVMRARPDSALSSFNGVLKASVSLDERRRKLGAFRDKLKSVGFGRMAKSWPNTRSDVLMIAANINGYKIGDMVVQNHLDAIRLAFEDSGLRTATFLTDVPRDHPSVQTALLGGTYGFKNEFDAARTSYSNRAAIDFGQLEGFDGLLGEIRKIFDIESITTRQIISNVIYQSLSIYQVFRDYLRLHNYKAVGIYCYYGIAGFGLSLACRELGIPLFDVQHGVSGKGHESYSYPNAPAEGYNSIPTHFLCWTREESDYIRSHLPNYGDRVVNIGHSWKLTESIILSGNPELPLINRARHMEVVTAFDAQARAAEEAFARTPGEKNVLIATYTNESLDWVPDLVERLGKRVNVFLRLHPGEAKTEGALEKRQAEMETLGVAVLDATRLSIPAVLPHMDLVVNRYSSIVRDAAAYGVSSLCYSGSAAWYHDPEVIESVTIVDHTAESIVDGVEAVLFSNPERVIPAAPSMDFADLKRVCKRMIEA
jgi:hypothetical protein